MEKPILYRPKETADYFQISAMTLWRWRRQEGFPQPLERGQVVLYDIKKILEWLENSKEVA